MVITTLAEVTNANVLSRAGDGSVPGPARDEGLHHRVHPGKEQDLVA